MIPLTHSVPVSDTHSRDQLNQKQDGDIAQELVVCKRLAELFQLQKVLPLSKASATREQKSRRMRRHDCLQASSWCHARVPRETIICLLLRCTMKVSNENALIYFCGLILHLLFANIERIELFSTT